MNLEHWLKRLWLAIGVVLFPLALLLAGFLVYSWIHDRVSDRPESLPVATNDPNPDSLRALRFGPPEEVTGSTTRAVRVRYGRGNYEDSEGFSSSGHLRYGDQYGGPAVNMVFLDSAGARSSLLLQAPGLIIRSDWPQGSSDTLQPFMLFEVIERDTDGDGRLTPKDWATLILTDLNGGSVRRPLPDSLIYDASALGLKRGTVVIYALEVRSGQDRKDRDNMRQRAFEYDLRSGSLTPFSTLEASVEEAARLLKAAPH